MKEGAVMPRIIGKNLLLETTSAKVDTILRENAP
jgi:hypothetical protein